MPYVDRNNRVCGFLDIEENGAFVRRYFLFDEASGMLQYFMDNPSNLPPDAQMIGYFQMQLVSFVHDASKARPKVPHCFSISLGGRKYFFRANDAGDKQGWINVLSNTAKITVSKDEPSRCVSQESLASNSSKGSCSYRAEIAGGMVVKTPVNLSDDSDAESSTDEMDWCFPRLSASSETAFYSVHQPVKVGFCVKQGGKRKNWKKRVFVLDKESLSYYKSREDKIPLRAIAVAEILDVRISIGVHPTKENLFEVVTEKRVFYVQAANASERDSWIACIKSVLESRNPVLSLGNRSSDPTVKTKNPLSPRQTWI
ncbi:hypothetical protein CAPTEDRAFT_189353 [Capitella teleta]|uniref:PH domain-containing protein n=1 Tax=Capitella teleta TaxID=283909 RepID=R7T3C8_CAPTE|nr:hypothetical protein CAPTEDRAFT_189353 [Capitella teleta]|eukprot:ELT87106.1 hypothetical protein CAPTEDRAFT_189353 [Capitella teleta]